ncbi:MAG: hypothetical protein J5906_11965 [Acidaminococcaceae bacterium]|nr:hypothetical protein [Acidaminococcaceae bacterium]
MCSFFPMRDFNILNIGKKKKETHNSIVEIVKYIATDQEKEGRELGITLAAEIYAPVLKKLENDHLALKNELDRETEDFDSQYKLLRKKAEYYVTQKEKVLKDIERLKKKKPELSDFIDNCLGTSFSASTIIAKYDDVIGDWLHEKMEKKRQKYFEIEFKKKERVWKKKITEIKAEIKKLTESLNALKTEDKQKLKQIVSLVNRSISDYELVLEQYNSFKNLL